MSKIEVTKFKNESDNKFRINIKMKTEIIIAKIFIDRINNDFE